jgi:preprotein translocase subunit SecA
MAATLSLDIIDALAHGVFPERRDQDEPLHDRWARSLLWRARRLVQPPMSRMRAAAADAGALATRVAAMPDEQIRQRLRQIAPVAVRAGRAEGLSEALALVREAAERSLGKRPFDTQLMGAAVLLEGRLAEMQTGEGKTLTAGLAATVAGVAGLPTHVVTVNDYLAQRDADLMAPLMRFFGLRVGVCIASLPQAAKAAAYACPVTYCTNQTLVFDYLRDRVASGGRANGAQMHARQLHGVLQQPLLLRGLHFAIVDEADSILIDEARTPLILSQLTGEAPEAGDYRQALAIAATLREGEHFHIDAARQALHLSGAGVEAIRQAAAPLPGVWRAARGRDHLASQALRALHLFHRDQHYVVIDGKVQIVDEYTGRVLEGRSWEGGLHQMIEAKESLGLTEPARTLARITFQRFFCRYLRLAGMTGTAAEVAGELQSVYRLDVVAVPTHKPDQRRTLPARLMATQAHKWQAVADALLAHQAAGRPVLVGTRSVRASEALSECLIARRCVHRVLNARQDAHEAEVIAEAGQIGTITVATNMAGRGTDIHLGEGVPRLGGLVVVLTECHDSARIDRQLVGRGARQGDPGVSQAIVALDDEIFHAHAPWLQALLQSAYAGRSELPAFWLRLLQRRAQRHAGRLHASMRRRTLRADRQLDNLLGFAGNQI